MSGETRGGRKATRMRGSSHARARLALAITPMIDVVFQLLVYFLLTAGYMARERHLRAEIPTSEQAGLDATPRLALETAPLVITVRRAAEGVAIGLPPMLGAPASVVSLEQTLRDAMLAPDRPNGLYPSDHPIRIAASDEVPWEDVVSVFNAVVAAGYRSVAFGGGS